MDNVQIVLDRTDMYMRPIRKVPTRPTTPELINTPAPSGKYRNFMEYAKHAVDLCGTASTLGLMVGFTGGTRISDWIRGRGGRPGIDSCLKLADITGDSPIDVLVMAGYQEEAELLVKFFGHDLGPDAPKGIGSTLIKTKIALTEAQALLDAAARKIEEM